MKAFKIEILFDAESDEETDAMESMILGILRKSQEMKIIQHSKFTKWVALSIDEQIEDCKEKLQLMRESIKKDGYNYFFDDNSIRIYEEKLKALLKQKREQQQQK
jgi:hypothetical protein